MSSENFGESGGQTLRDLTEKSINFSSDTWSKNSNNLKNYLIESNNGTVKSSLFLDFEVIEGSRVAARNATCFKIISIYCTASEVLVRQHKC